MAFEGEHKIIPLNGIMRAGTDTVCEDGAMNEVIGLEYKDGSYVPYSGEVHDKAILPQRTKFFAVHKTSSGNNIIAYHENTDQEMILVWMSEENFNQGLGVDDNNWNTIHVGEIKDLEFVGNAICFSTKDNYEVSIFKEGTYTSLKKNSNLNIQIRVTEGVCNINNSIGVYNEYISEASDSSASTIEADFTAAIGLAQEKGGLTGSVFAAVALRLKTGELVFMSNVIMTPAPRETAGLNSAILEDDSKFYLLPRVTDEYSSGYVLKTNHSNLDKDNVFYDDGYNEAVAYRVNYSDAKGVKYAPAIFREHYERFSAGSVSYVTRVNVVCNKIQFYIDEGEIFSDDVDGLCVLISREIDRYENLTDTINIYGGVGAIDGGNESALSTSYLRGISDEGIKNRLEDYSTLYVVEEIPIIELKYGEWVDVDLKGKLGSNTATLSPVNTADAIMFNYANGYMQAYNRRIHIYDFTRGLDYPYNPLMYFKKAGDGVYVKYIEDTYPSSGSFEAYARVAIRFKDNDNLNSQIVLPFQKYDGVISLGSYVSFPYAKAYEIIVQAHAIIDYYENKYYEKVIQLKNNVNQGVAFSYSSSHTLTEVESLTDLDNTFERTNNNGGVLVVSDVNNPNYFNKQNAYTIGKGSIIGLAPLSIALSQDTFGQYPLLVFCTDGIYSMGVDTTGAGVYNNIAPFSREVCINRNTICPIDGAVLFASSKGLMMATPQGVQEFLPKLNGDVRNLPQASENARGLGFVWYKDIISQNACVELIKMGESGDFIYDYCSISTDDFIDFLSDKDTYVSYVSNKNKIIVYNEDKDYVYWIDIPTRNVTKLPISIKLDNNNYPTEQYLTSDDNVLNFNYKLDQTDVPCLLQTRPIKIASGFKGSIRVIARGRFYSDGVGKHAVMLVLGSYDAVHWQPIGYKSKPLFDSGFNDLGCVTDRVSWKYMMVIIAGSLRDDSHIDGIELTVNGKYNNKLR